MTHRSGRQIGMALPVLRRRSDPRRVPSRATRSPAGGEQRRAHHFAGEAPLGHRARQRVTGGATEQRCAHHFASEVPNPKPSPGAGRVRWHGKRHRSGGFGGEAGHGGRARRPEVRAGAGHCAPLRFGGASHRTSAAYRAAAWCRHCLGAGEAVGRQGTDASRGRWRRLRRRSGTDGERGVGVHGSWNGVTCAAGPRFDADRRNASWAAVRGGPPVPDFGGAAAGGRRRAWRGEGRPSVRRHCSGTSPR